MECFPFGKRLGSCRYRTARICRLALNGLKHAGSTAAEVADLFGKYRLSEALMAVYKLFWDEFSSWYLEMIKPAYGQPIDKATYEKTLGFFDNLLSCCIRSCLSLPKSCGNIYMTAKKGKA